MRDRLFHVLDGDQPDAAILVVDDEQLLDAMRMQHPLRLVLADALAHRDEEVLMPSISSETFCLGLVANRTSRLVRMPTSFPGTFLAAPVTTGMPEMPWSFISASASDSVASGPNRQRIDHHAGFVLLDLPRRPYHFRM